MENFIIYFFKSRYLRIQNYTKIWKLLRMYKNIKHRKSFVKLRLSDHNLMIEKGRRKRPMLPRNERLCDTCNKLEDEIHFLIECDNYKCERFEKFKTITEEVPNFEQITDSKTKFIFLMTQENENILNLIASCTRLVQIKNTHNIRSWMI